MGAASRYPVQPHGYVPRVRFQFHVKPHGWATAVFEASSEVAVSFEVSYMADGLAQLVDALLGLRAGQPDASVGWAEEPGSHRLAFERHGDHVRMSIWHHQDDLWGEQLDNEGAGGILVFRVTEPLDELVASVAAGLAAVSAPGYEKSFRMPFPAAALDSLCAPRAD